jgi:Xaa-Pro aminopeptidase
MDPVGKSVQDKLKELRAHIQDKNAFGTVVSALDEIAWLFNLRGSDIECNPVFFSYAIVSDKDAILYLDLDKVTDDVKTHLGSSVTLKPYTDFFADLKELKLNNKRVLVNNKTSLAVEVAVGEVK